MKIDFNSQDSCWRAYLDYQLFGSNGRLGVTDDDMSIILERWASEISRWQENLEDYDDVYYDVDDSEVANAKDATENEYGEDVDLNGERREKNRNIMMTTGAGGLSVLGGVLGGINGGGKVLKALSKFKFKGMTANGNIVGAIVSFVASALSCVSSFLVGKMAVNDVNNKEEYDAIMAMNAEMVNMQQDLLEESEYMDKLEEEITTLADEAQQINEDANSEIVAEKTDYDSDMREFEYIKSLISAGEPLTDSQINIYNARLAELNSTASNINNISNNTSEAVDGKYSEIEDFSSEYDSVLTNIADVQGFTDYAAEIDETTQKMCEKQKNVFNSNAIVAVAAAASMVISTAALAIHLSVSIPVAGWIAAAAIGVAGAFLTGLAIKGGDLSYKAALKQEEMSLALDPAIANRQATQDLEQITLDHYNEELDALEGTLDNIDNMELIKPKEMSAPVNDTPVSNDSGNNDDDKPKDEPEE